MNSNGKGSNEEFSIEFGDVNGIKLYEVLNKSERNHKRTLVKKGKPD